MWSHYDRLMVACWHRPQHPARSPSGTPASSVTSAPHGHPDRERYAAPHRKRLVPASPRTISKHLSAGTARSCSTTYLGQNVRLVSSSVDGVAIGPVDHQGAGWDCGGVEDEEIRVDYQPREVAVVIDEARRGYVLQCLRP